MSDGQTHWEGCWAERGHHECAQQKIRDLLAEKRLNKQRARNALRFLGGDPQIAAARRTLEKIIAESRP